MHGHSVDIRELVQHLCRGDRLDDRSPQSPHLQEIVANQAIDSKLINKVPKLITESNPVSISIIDDSHIGIDLLHEAQPMVDVRRNRLRPAHVRKDWIALVVHLMHPGAASAK